ncbi:hypothetical protein L9F63_019148, partial [Diploptera punctata]
LRGFDHWPTIATTIIFDYVRGIELCDIVFIVMNLEPFYKQRKTFPLILREKYILSIDGITYKGLQEVFVGIQSCVKRGLNRWTTVACAPSLLHSSSFSRKSTLNIPQTEFIYWNRRCPFPNVLHLLTFVSEIPEELSFSELISIVSSLWSTGVMSFFGGFLLTSIGGPMNLSLDQTV